MKEIYIYLHGVRSKNINFFIAASLSPAKSLLNSVNNEDQNFY